MTTGTPVGRRGFLGAAAASATLGTVGTGRGAVDPELADQSGRVGAIVRLEAGPAEVLKDRPGPHAVTALRQHATSTQQGVVDYVSRTSGIEIRRRFWLANAVLVSVDTTTASFADLAALDGVDRVHRTDAGAAQPRADRTDADAGVPQTDGADPFSYGLEMMHVPEVWDRFDTRGEGARIAVIDTGVDASHPDVDLAEWAEFDAEGQRVDSEPYDPDGHGTGMSALATGGDASGTQIGAAPAADLLVARHAPDGLLPASLAALEWAVENGADAISMSFDLGPLAYEVIEPIRNAIAAGSVPIVSTVGPELYLSPNAVYDPINTGAVDRDRNPYKNGNGGEIRTERYWRSDAVPEDWPDRYVVPTVAAPGVDNLVAVPDNDDYDGGHARQDGTSNTPPHVSGIVALLRSLDPDLSPGEIQRILTETARQPGARFEHEDPNGDFGHGIVDALAAAGAAVGRDRGVSGTVTDADGAPVAGAAVTASTGATTRTDDQGRYELPVPDGTADVTASAVGYEPVTRGVSPGSEKGLSFAAERRPDVQRTARTPTVVVPGETAVVELDVEHAEFATVLVRDSSALVGRSTVTLRLNGESLPVGEPVDVDGATTLRLAIDTDPGARGLLPLDVSLAAGERTADLSLDTIRIHEQPMTVSEDAALQRALDVAAPETTVRLAGDRWDLSVEPFESPLADTRFRFPFFEESRGDEAGLVVDKPLTLAAAEGHDPTLVATGGSADARTFGIQILSHFVTIRDLEVVAEGATAAVSVLDGDGVHLIGVTLAEATDGVLAQFTKSLVVDGATITATGVGVSLRDLSLNALINETTVREADRGVFLSGRSGDRLFEVDATVTGNTFEGVATALDREGPVTIRSQDGEAKAGGETPPAASSLDLVLYAATALSVGVLFYPYGKRRLRGRR